MVPLCPGDGTNVPLWVPRWQSFAHRERRRIKQAVAPEHRKEEGGEAAHPTRGRQGRLKWKFGPRRDPCAAQMENIRPVHDFASFPANARSSFRFWLEAPAKNLSRRREGRSGAADSDTFGPLARPDPSNRIWYGWTSRAFANFSRVASDGTV